MYNVHVHAAAWKVNFTMNCHSQILFVGQSDFQCHLYHIFVQTYIHVHVIDMYLYMSQRHSE